MNNFIICILCLVNVNGSFFLQEAKMRKKLKVKLEMVKFLQETLDTMSLEGNGHSSQSAKDFVEFFEKVC